MELLGEDTDHATGSGEVRHKREFDGQPGGPFAFVEQDGLRAQLEPGDRVLGVDIDTEFGDSRGVVTSKRICRTLEFYFAGPVDQRVGTLGPPKIRSAHSGQFIAVARGREVGWHVQDRNRDIPVGKLFPEGLALAE